MGYMTAATTGVILSSGNTVFNEASADKDFRIESDDNTHQLFVDAGNNRLGIGTSTPSSSVDIEDGLTTVGAVLTLSTKEPTVVDEDVIGQINFRAPLETGADALLLLASISAVANEAFDADQNQTELVLSTASGAAAAERVRITHDGDVQVAGLTASEILITDANKGLTSAAVGTYPSLAELIHVKGVTSAIQTQLDSAGGSFSIHGQSAVQIASGDFIALSDTTDSNATKKESIDDVATLFAGAGMTATSAVLNVIGGTGITANANDIAITAGGVGTTQLANSGVTLAKMANIADDTMLGNISGSAAAPAAMSIANVHTLIGEATGSITGLMSTAHHDKLDSIEASATADQTAAQIKTLLENGIDSVHYVNASIDNEHLADDAVGADELAANAVVNASVAAGAAIAYTKLAALASTNVLVGNGSNVATAVAVSGDVTMANTGAVTIGADKITADMIGDDVLNSEHYAAGSIDNEHLATGIDSVKIADGSVTNAEFQYISTLSSNAQDQLATKEQIGKKTMWVPSAAMSPTASNGCSALTTVETTSGRPDMVVLDFDKDSDEFAQFAVAFPKSWNLGTVTFQVFWSGIAATTDCDWQLQGVAMNDNETIDVAYGTAVVVTDNAQGAVEELLVSAESGAVTIAGTPADNDLCYFRVGRDVSGDAMAGDARLHGIKILYTTDAVNDA